MGFQTLCAPVCPASRVCMCRHVPPCVAVRVRLCACVRVCDTWFLTPQGPRLPAPPASCSRPLPQCG